MRLGRNVALLGAISSCAQHKERVHLDFVHESTLPVYETRILRVCQKEPEAAVARFMNRSDPFSFTDVEWQPTTKRGSNEDTYHLRVEVFALDITRSKRDASF